MQALQAFHTFSKEKGIEPPGDFSFLFFQKKKKNPSSPRDFGDRKFCENPASLAGAWTGLTPPLPRPRWPRPPRAPRVYLHARAHAQGLRLPARTYADRASGLVGPVGRAGLRWLFTQCEGVPPSLSCCLLWVPRYRPTTRRTRPPSPPRRLSRASAARSAASCVQTARPIRSHVRMQGTPSQECDKGAL